MSHLSKEPESESEEQSQRSRFKTFDPSTGKGNLSSVVGVEIERSPDDGPSTFAYSRKCPHCSDWAVRDDAGHEAHFAECEKIAEARMAEGPKPLPFSAVKELEEMYPDPSAMPTKSLAVSGINRCKRLLGANAFLGIGIDEQDILKGGIIIPKSVTSLDEEYFELFKRIKLVRVVRVSDVMSRHPQSGELVYPFLAEWKDTLDRGDPGPIVEIAPGSGVMRKGDDGEACMYCLGVNVWAEYFEPEDDED